MYCLQLRLCEAWVRYLTLLWLSASLYLRVSVVPNEPAVWGPHGPGAAECN
jgi:hypothetical protein